MKQEALVHLHTHTDHSVLDGHASVDDLAKYISEMGQIGFAITDHGTMTNTYNGWKAAKKIREETGKPFYFIPGIEAYVTPGDAHRSTREKIFFSSNSHDNKEERSNDVSGGGAYTHMTLLGETTEGMHNLFRLNSLAFHDGIYRKPRMDIESIAKYSKGIIGTTGCPSGELQTRLRLGQWKEAIAYASKMQDILGKENYFLELMDHNMSIDLERKVRGDLMKVAKELSIPLLVTNDLHYVRREDAHDHEHMLCVQSGSSMNDMPYEKGGKRFAFEGEEYYAKTSAEMEALFPHEDYPYAIQNSSEIAKRCSADFSYNAELRPTVELPDNHDEHSYLRQLTFEGLRRKVPKKMEDPEYLERIEKELGVLKEKNFSGYILVVSDFMIWAKNNGVYCGPGRGCLSGDTLIPTSEGHKKISDLKVGDNVFDENGALIEIPAVFEWECDEELVEISSYYGANPIKMTTDHKVLVSKANRDISKTLKTRGYSYAKGINTPEWIRADEVEIGDLVVMPKINYSDDFKGFDVDTSSVATSIDGNINSFIPANKNLGIILGIFVSDGWNRKKSSEIGFTQKRSEDEGFIPNVFKSVFGIDLPYTDSTTADLRHYRTNNKSIVDLFQKAFPDYNQEDHMKNIPSILMNSSEEFRRGLLEGLGYGDGTHKENTSYSITSSKLAQNVHMLLVSLGVNSGIKECNGTDKQPEFKVTASRVNNEMGFAYDGKFMYQRVREINMVPAEGKVYDFRVDTTNSYVTESFVVHNSGGGSLVCYLTDITEIDPIPHGLIFERFLNPERDSPPDIDSDFDDENRARVIEYVRNKYGEEMVSMIITFGLIKAKSAIKDVARIYDEPFAIGKELNDALPPAVSGREITIGEIYDKNAPRYIEAEAFRETVERLDKQQLIQDALGIEGKMRQTGVHAAGVIMSSKPLRDSIPLMMRTTDNATITQFDYPTCEDLGLIKMDFLGLTNLTIIRKAVDAIYRNHGINLNIQEIYDTALTNPNQKAFDIINAGRTLGIFQLDSGGITSLAMLVNVTSFNDISALLALYRPGPMGMDSHVKYADRKNGREEIVPIHPELKEALEPILSETYQLICYQEQIQFIAQKVANYSLGRADILRRAMGKKKKSLLDAEFIPFNAGMKENGYSDEAILALWETLIPFAEYGFNKSHSAAYGLISYLTAWLKAEYPVEFMAAILSTLTDDKDKTALYLAECRHMGIKVLPPDVSKSTPDYTATKEGNILVGLRAIRGVGENVALELNKIAVERGGFKDIDDFMNNAPASSLSKTALEGFSHGGALDSFGYSRRSLFKYLPENGSSFAKVKRKEEAGQSSLFDAFDDVASPCVEIQNLPEYTKKDKLMFERHMLGLYVSDHPLSGIAEMLERFADTRVTDILNGIVQPSSGFGDRKKVRLAGVMVNVVKKQTRKGTMIGLFEFEDTTGSMQGIVFPKTFERLGSQLKNDTVYELVGSVIGGEDGDALKIAVDSLKEIELTDDGAIPFIVNLRKSQTSEAAVRELQKSIKRYPGVMPVHLRIIDDKGGVQVMALGAEYRVKSDYNLIQELRSLFGVYAVN